MRYALIQGGDNIWWKKLFQLPFSFGFEKSNNRLFSTTGLVQLTGGRVTAPEATSYLLATPLLRPLCYSSRGRAGMSARQVIMCHICPLRSHVLIRVLPKWKYHRGYYLPLRLLFKCKSSLWTAGWLISFNNEQTEVFWRGNVFSLCQARNDVLESIDGPSSSFLKSMFIKI